MPRTNCLTCDPLDLSTIYNRRRFLAATLEAVAGVAFTGLASALRAAPDQPAGNTSDFTLIDTHTHFYDPSPRRPLAATR